MLPGAQDTQTEIASALDLCGELAAKYELHSLSRLLDATRETAQSEEIRVAVFGRFKAGKSSFLNRLIGRDVLPVGVIPVTAVVTELRFGERTRALVLFRDGRQEEVCINRIGAYATESENPGNGKGVERIAVELPELRRMLPFTLVDTPGLESVLAHNTEASMDWLPRVGLALVAIGVDPPLSEHDLELLKTLARHTPRIAVLLTKADLVSAAELAEIIGFVRTQLRQRLGAKAPEVFPYSTRKEFCQFQEALEAALLGSTRGARDEVLLRKLETLLGECSAYLWLAHSSAALAESERQRAVSQIAEEERAQQEVRRMIHLAIGQAAVEARARAAARLELHEKEIASRMLDEFEGQFPGWGRSLGPVLTAFEQWLESALRHSLAGVSSAERASLLADFHQVRGQVLRMLQQLRDRLSDCTLRVCGVPLRTTETEIEVAGPAPPDIRIGRIFDRNWELLSPVLPYWAIRATLHGHFARRIPYAIYQNLSRLAAQWEASIQSALAAVEAEAARRLDDLIGTVERLIYAGGSRRPNEIRADIERLEQARQSLAGLP
jgi:GTP-binding protein EngB required for normal cell division